MDYYIGIDIGGTNTKTAVIDKDLNPIGSLSVQTDPEAVCRAAADAVRSLLKMTGIDPGSIAGIGTGIPGIIEGPKGPVVYAPNLNLKGTDAVFQLASELAARDIPVSADLIFLENDANCAGIAECTLGAGKEADLLLLLTLGTGLGGSVLKGGKPFPFGKYGGELGHFPFRFGGADCPCGMSGCLERYTNSAAFQEFGFDTYTTYLAAGIAGYINIFRPDLVVLAGGVTNECDRFFQVLNEKTASCVYAGDYLAPPKIVRTALKNDAGAIGAALAARLQLAD